MNFYSQFKEDFWLYDHNVLPEKGFFVDVGAGHPVRMSNTYALEESGWNGLCIDADPRNTHPLLTMRKQSFFSAVSDMDGIIEFYLNPHTADVSKLEPQDGYKKIMVPCFTLPTIFQYFNIRSIDFLSIDIEGEEIKALDPLFRHTTIRPKVLCIEYITSLVSHEEFVKSFMQLIPAYKEIHQTEANLIYQLQ